MPGSMLGLASMHDCETPVYKMNEQLRKSYKLWFPCELFPILLTGEKFVIIIRTI